MSGTTDTPRGHRGGSSASFNEWYTRERCPGSPFNSRRFIRLSETIREADFDEAIEPDEVEWWVRDVLRHCVERFDPQQGRPDIPVEERFVRLFRSRLRMKWRDTARDQERGRRTKSCERHCQWRQDLASADPSVLAFERWARVLMNEAVSRLDDEARALAELHRYQGLSMIKTAKELGVSRRYLRKYGGGRLADLIRAEIRAWALDQLRRGTCRVVLEMDATGFLDAEEIASLLFLDPRDVLGALRMPA